MKAKPCKHLEVNRVTSGRRASTAEYGNNGEFQIPSPDPGLRVLNIVASDGAGWDHVSIHVLDRNGKPETPTWNEMSYVKGLFWSAEETVLEFHPKRSAYVNAHPDVLHLWKQQGVEAVLPPHWCV